MDFVREPDGFIEGPRGRIAVFRTDPGANIDPVTVASFGNEWARFQDFSDDEIRRIGDEYFDIVTPEMLGDGCVALDLGCGSGRWTRYVAGSCASVEAVDPSDSVLTAAALTGDLDNVRVTQASADNIPFADGAFDFILCLGALHHIPDTAAALDAAVEKLKPGGWILLYIYYALENRGPFYRAAFRLSSSLRYLISKMPAFPKELSCDLIAALVYLPLVGTARVTRALFGEAAFTKVPLHYYADKSWFVIRNDALDRFGTPLEQRFTRIQIERMMTEAGLGDVRFSEQAPYWHAVGKEGGGMKRILVICPHPENVAPGQRLKYEQYFDHWRANGYEVVVSPFMTRRLQSIVYAPGRLLEKVFWVVWGYIRRVLDLCRLPFYDGAYIFLWVTPFGPPLFEWVYSLVTRRFVYDIDDMVFLGHSSAANRGIQFLKGRRKMIYLMRKADHVIVCTPHLNEFVGRYNERTTDISSTIETTDYLPLNPYSNDRRPTLGWSGSHSTAKYLHLLDDILRDLAKELDFRLKVIGDPDFTIDGVDVHAQAWKRATEVEDLQEIDIGLYPLPEEEWVLGKSGLKALQYMALGIPTVATDIGANRRIIEDGGNGFLVTDAPAWQERIKMLIADPSLRRRMGESARQTVDDRFSVRANRGGYLRVLDGVFGDD